MSEEEKLILQYKLKKVNIKTFANTLIDRFKLQGYLDADQSRWLIEYLLIEREDNNV